MSTGGHPVRFAGPADLEQLPAVEAAADVPRRTPSPPTARELAAGPCDGADTGLGLDRHGLRVAMVQPVT
ncbi:MULTISPECIES: hypothetical protein [unclassified Modestobacter]